MDEMMSEGLQSSDSHTTMQPSSGAPAPAHPQEGEHHEHHHSHTTQAALFGGALGYPHMMADLEQRRHWIDDRSGLHSDNFLEYREKHGGLNIRSAILVGLGSAALLGGAAFALLAAAHVGFAALIGTGIALATGALAGNVNLQMQNTRFAAHYTEYLDGEAKKAQVMERSHGAQIASQAAKGGSRSILAELLNLGQAASMDDPMAMSEGFGKQHHNDQPEQPLPTQTHPHKPEEAPKPTDHKDHNPPAQNTEKKLEEDPVMPADLMVAEQVTTVDPVTQTIEQQTIIEPLTAALETAPSQVTTPEQATASDQIATQDLSEDFGWHRHHDDKPKEPETENKDQGKEHTGDAKAPADAQHPKEAKDQHTEEKPPHFVEETGEQSASPLVESSLGMA